MRAKRVSRGRPRSGASMDDGRQRLDPQAIGRRHPARLPEESYRNINRPMMVTCCARRHWPVLVGETAATVCEVLRHAAARRRSDLYGYCLMPDHLHFVIRLAEDGTPPVFLRYFKGEASRRINVLWGRSGAFRWQRSYWDEFAHDAEVLQNQMRYMLANPVRRGLCGLAEDWPHSADLREGRRGRTSDLREAHIARPAHDM
ncbi:MAG TPA: hypothetical protein DEP45_10300 [Armatimonadetes bacterium]|nr:hypothetical protein [Armatimonadota bacterium]